MSSDVPKPISDDEVVALAKAAFEHSRQDLNHRAAAETPRELQQQQQPGITLDLGHKNIARLPDEVIDVIRDEIERCAFLHCHHGMHSGLTNKSGSRSLTTSSRRCRPV